MNMKWLLIEITETVEELKAIMPAIPGLLKCPYKSMYYKSGFLA